MIKSLKFPVNFCPLKCIILICGLTLAFSAAKGQDSRKLSGTVLDSLKDVIAGADVYVIADKDTLNTISDNKGNFLFSGIKANNISLMILSIGFKPFIQSYTYKSKQVNMILDAIVLSPESNLLDEVVINGRDNPIKLKKDTVEYRASYYQISENDRVEDLLRQLPGVEIDANGDVTTMGKPLVKLRVNGQDFFTGNVKDFIGQLPANVIDKLQIINDFGDEANFTGIKSGQSQKMLNLVTKDGQNKGTFGNIGASVGTNERYGLVANGNIWQDSKQIGIIANSNNTNNEAGINTTANAGVNYRDKLANGITASAGYNYGYNKNLSRQSNFIETISQRGSITNDQTSESNSKDNTHNINFNIQSVANKSYFQASLTGGLASKDRNGSSNSQQRGLIVQDLEGGTVSNTEVPNINGNFVWARSMDKPGRSLSAAVDMSSGINQINEELRNKIIYYDQFSDVAIKDSLVNRFVETENRSNSITADFRYSEPLKYSKDSVIKRNIDFSYFFSFNTTRNSLYTRVINSIGNTAVVDSLSSLYSSSFLLHRFAINYRYQSQKLNYSLGATVQPSQLTGQYQGNETKINHAEINISPIVNLSYNISEWESLAFVYTGSSTAPDFYQLQPVPNITNLQNVIIGDPNLKSSFTHSGNLSYQHTNAVNGSLFMLGINGSVLEDQVVSNVVLLQDTLSLKQETRFRNANGAYSIGSLYSFSVPIAKNKFNAELRGTLDYNNSISYANYLLNKNRNINFSQTLRLKMNQKKLSLSGSASYNYSSNRYSVALFKLNNIETWQFNMNGKTFISKTLVATADVSKRINSGYSFDIGNPLLINMGIEKTLLKSRQATIAFQAYDLLKQGNNLTRIITDNSITDSRYNQITRYFLVSFNYRLQNFGKKP